jgi:hypothetical protein
MSRSANSIRSRSRNALSDAVRFFHIDALSSAVGLKVDFDMAMVVLASGLYRLSPHESSIRDARLSSD